MSNCPFCNLDSSTKVAVPNPHAGNSRIGLFRRAWQGIQWLFPATVLILMPKCPMCVAAYVALFTGIGVSTSTGRWIQILMLLLCVTSLAYLVVRYLRRSWQGQRLPAS